VRIPRYCDNPTRDRLQSDDVRPSEIPGFLKKQMRDSYVPENVLGSLEKLKNVSGHYWGYAIGAKLFDQNTAKQLKALHGQFNGRGPHDNEMVPKITSILDDLRAEPRQK